MKTLPNKPLKFSSGQEMKNRFMLAPMTNSQSFENGELSDEEYHWLSMRAKGQFGLVMTCASHVQEIGKGFPGQLGIFSDKLIAGHQRLTTEIKSHGSLAVIQLHHAGMRSPKELISEAPVCPSANEKYDARELSLQEVKQLREDFIQAAIRSQKSGYDGVEIHGAHGYILAQFLSPEINQRNDEYGGSLKNRCRLIEEIINGIRENCGEEFLLGLRLSPERFGQKLSEIKQFCQDLIADNKLDFLDISLWDYKKLPEEEEFQDKTLLDHFNELDRKETLITVAGKIDNGQDVQNILDAGVDFVSIGRSGILHHNFPELVMQDPNFEVIATPVSKEHLIKEGLSDRFVTYMRRWPDFVAK